MKIDLHDAGAARLRRLAARCLLAPAVRGRASAQSDAERVRAAKALTLDRKYAEARTAWTAILASASGADADAAAYWIARSSEKLGEHERAFKEYGDVPGPPARRPQPGRRGAHQPHRPGRAALPAGQTSLRERAARGPDRRRTRPSATSRPCSWAAWARPPASGRCPCCRRSWRRRPTPDLLDRARIVLLKIDPKALTQAPAAGAGGGPACRAARRARPAGCACASSRRARASPRSPSTSPWRWRTSCSRACPTRPGASSGRRATTPTTSGGS